MFRLYFLVFEGEYRGGAAAVTETHGDDDEMRTRTPRMAHDDHGHGHAPTSRPPAMTVVLWILAAGSLLVGLLGIPDVIWPGHDLFGEWLSPVLPPLAHEESLRGFVEFALIALGVSLLGIGHDRFLPGLKQLVETVREASHGQTKLFIQIIDFLSVKRRPDPAKYFQRFLEITDRHRTDCPKLTEDSSWIGADETEHSRLSQ